MCVCVCWAAKFPPVKHTTLPASERHLVHTEGGSNRTDVSLHTMGSKHNGRVSLLKTFERKPCNGLFWSPSGAILLLANLKGARRRLAAAPRLLAARAEAGRLWAHREAGA